MGFSRRMENFHYTIIFRKTKILTIWSQIFDSKVFFFCLFWWKSCCWHIRTRLASFNHCHTAISEKVVVVNSLYSNRKELWGSSRSSNLLPYYWHWHCRFIIMLRSYKNNLLWRVITHYDCTQNSFRFQYRLLTMIDNLFFEIAVFAFAACWHCVSFEICTIWFLIYDRVPSWYSKSYKFVFSSILINWINKTNSLQIDHTCPILIIDEKWKIPSPIFWKWLTLFHWPYLTVNISVRNKNKHT